MSKNEVTVTVKGRPMPAIRLTQRSKWKNPRAKAMYAWRDKIRRAYLEQAGRLHDEPVAVVMVFYRRDARPDLDNLVKAALDSLSGVAWKTDTAKQIPSLSAKFVKVKKDEDEGLALAVGPVEGA